MGHDSMQIEVLARGVMLHSGHVLLCRNIKHGYHYLPGGHVEFSETAAAALARELEEEAGLAVRVGRCLHVHEQIFRQGGRLRHELNVVFHVEHTLKARGSDTPEVTSREKKIAFDWVRLDNLDSVKLFPESCRGWLEALSDGVEHAPTTWLGSSETD